MSQPHISLEDRLGRIESEHQSRQQYSPQMVVYLSQGDRKRPTDWTGWDEEAHREIDRLLIPVSAYRASPGDLVNGWLIRCAKEASTEYARIAVLDYCLMLRYQG